MVGFRKHMALFCVLAYLVVFAHSAIPHDHHHFCHEAPIESREGNQSHYGSCDELDMYLMQSDTHSQAHQAFWAGIASLGEAVPGFIPDRLVTSSGDSYTSHCSQSPFLRNRLLRAPPAY